MSLYDGDGSRIPRTIEEEDDQIDRDNRASEMTQWRERQMRPTSSPAAPWRDPAPVAVRDWWCQVTSEVTGEDGPSEQLVCARPEGHDGDHWWMVKSNDHD